MPHTRGGGRGGPAVGSKTFELVVIAVPCALWWSFLVTLVKMVGCYWTTVGTGGATARLERSSSCVWNGLRACVRVRSFVRCSSVFPKPSLPGQYICIVVEVPWDCHGTHCPGEPIMGDSMSRPLTHE